MPLSLEDKQAITELTARYNHAIDHKRAEEWADTFVENGSLLSDGRLLCHDRQSRIEFVKKAEAAGLKSRHWVCNLLIDGAGERARLRMYVMSIAFVDGIQPYTLGEYDDSLVKVNGQWKFEKRTITRYAGKSFTDGGLKGVAAIPPGS